MTSVEIVRTFITRLNEINPILNAIVQENFQQALHQAQQIDDRIQNVGCDSTLPEFIQVEKIIFAAIKEIIDKAKNVLCILGLLEQ